jgi:molybdopterin-guanine dinucleotide biosynthesis protein A
MIRDSIAVVMAGGDSRRMGQDKANLLLGEHTLLQSVVATLQPLFAEVILSVRQPRPEIDLTQVCDDPAHSGPLAGLAAALEHATTPWIFAVACDMPFITPAVVEYLALQRADYQAVVPMVGGFPQPMAAFYAKSCLDEVRACLHGNGKHSFRALLDKIQVLYVSEVQLQDIDPQLRSFFDLDTPQDVARAMNREEGT